MNLFLSLILHILKWQLESVIFRWAHVIFRCCYIYVFIFNMQVNIRNMFVIICNNFMNIRYIQMTICINLGFEIISYLPIKINVDMRSNVDNPISAALSSTVIQIAWWSLSYCTTALDYIPNQHVPNYVFFCLSICTSSPQTIIVYLVLHI